MKKQTEDRLDLKKLLFILDESGRGLVFLVSLFLFLSLMDILGLAIIGQYISFIVEPKNQFAWVGDFVFPVSGEYEQMLIIGGLVSVVFLLKFLFGLFVNKKILEYCFNSSVDIQTRLMRAYQAIPYQSFINRNSAEYAQMINKQATHFTQVTLQFAIRIISEGIVALAIFSFLTYHSYIALLIIACVVFLVVTIYNYIFRDKLVNYGNIVHKESSSMFKITQEAFDSYKEIKAIGKEELFVGKLQESAEKFANSYTRSSLISTSPRYFSELIMVLTMTLIFVVFSYLGQDANVVIPLLGVVAIALVRLVPIVNIVASGLSQVKFGLSPALEIYKDLVRCEKPSEEGVNIQSCDFKSISFAGVGYRYNNSSNSILENVNIRIEKGDFVGIIGSSGSGKTTFIDLLLGFLHPSSGEIYYNDEPNFQEKVACLRSELYYMSQNGVLLDDSVAINVALPVGNQKVEERLVIDALRVVGLSDWVKDLPKGIYSRVGKDGVQISGGQRQRIGLARAIYSRKRILVLDEPTSSLDSKTEEDIVNTIRNLKGRTIILISHRINTLCYSNKILKVKDRSISKIGNYDDLLALR